MIIPGKSSRSVPFEINIPNNAEPGGHFGSLVIKTIPSTDLAASGATLSQELGALILLRVAGEVQEQASISSFLTTSKIYETGPVNFNLRLSNDGSVHIRPKGTIVITNMLGQKVASLELESKNVLPGATRLMTTPWDIKYAFGRYTATLVASYGREATPLSSTLTFSIIPYRLLSLLLVIVIILVIFLIRAKKRLKLALKILFSGKA